ncbi:TadE/TadG family type IV pilus assembly protein [Limnoglobus roseus]|uniref:Pilus assembly protein n=1 Tax=Limnoglobus roseus TaxID=2598579 RepID=A0A5C1AS90_9BACT|nr:TadE/TadG family type IV pilus assembly protein [Limnoglobus roseus]QEL21017.1 pilus assembly protein [Limnoglobus roseus]
MTVPHKTRGGATAVEMALVLPIVCLLVIGFIIGGMDLLRYQQVACLAREGARWASVRGADYGVDAGQSSPTQQQIVDQAIVPRTAAMDPTALSVRVQLIDKGNNTVQDWDASSKAVRSITATGEYVSNAIRVTVTYQITANALGDPLTLQGVCEMSMVN